MRRSGGGNGKDGGRGTRLPGGGRGRGRKDDGSVELVVAVAEAAEKEKLEMKEAKLQRALANMRSKVRALQSINNVCTTLVVRLCLFYRSHSHVYGQCLCIKAWVVSLSSSTARRRVSQATSTRHRVSQCLITQWKPSISVDLRYETAEYHKQIRLFPEVLKTVCIYIF